MTDWTKAKCADDPDAMFPRRAADQKRAARLCVGCDVRQECLTYALVHDQRWGVWGGLTERDRAKLIGRDKYGRKTAAKVRKVCPCGAEFTGWRQSRLCTDCRTRNDRDYQRGYRARTKAAV